MATAYVSIGSNIEREIHIPGSLRALTQHFGELNTSSIYECAAVGFTGDAFYNLVVGFESLLPVKALTAILRQIELDHGRTRDCQKFSARTLDLDLILYGDLVISEGRLQIPRDEIARYAFVLEPLAEIAPTLKHPITQVDYATLWAAFDKTGLQQRRITATWVSTV